MKYVFSIIGKVIGWTLLTAAFACIGLGTDDPQLMVPVYGISFLVISGLILFYHSMNKRRTFDKKEMPVIVPMIFGALLVILSILCPIFTLKGVLPEIGFGNIAGLTLLLVVLGFAGVYVINILSRKIKFIQIAGYLIVIFMAALPAFLVAPISPTVEALGTLYFTLTIVAVVAWAGFALVFPAKEN